MKFRKTFGEFLNEQKKSANEDLIPGGKGDKTDPRYLDPEELAVGMEVEKEHVGNDSKKTKEIATDHLTEDPKYYSKLIAAGLADEHPAIKLAKEYGWKLKKQDNEELKNLKTFEEFLNEQKQLLTSPKQLLMNAQKSGYIDIDTMLDKQTLKIATEVIQQWTDDQDPDGDFGSSDMTYLMQDFLNELGLKTIFKNHKLTVVKESVNELKRSLVSGTKAGSVHALEDREYELMKDVRDAKSGDYINIVLPKGTIIKNLPGGVFAMHPDLKKKYGSNSNWTNKYGLGITSIEKTLGDIEDAGKVLESVNESINEGIDAHNVTELRDRFSEIVQGIEDTYYGITDNIDKLVEFLGDASNEDNAWKEELKIFEQVKKLVDKSKLGKFI